MRRLFCSLAALSFLWAAPAFAQSPQASLSMNRVYQGPIQLPDFRGRDREFANFRTRIVNEMKTGPNFAGHYAVVEIGCGTSCRFVYVADVATGKVFAFPYGGEEYYMLDLSYGVKSDTVTAKWYSNDYCYIDYVTWNGAQFLSSGKRVIGRGYDCK